MSEVCDPIVSTQVSYVDTFEEGERVTTHAGLRDEIEDLLVAVSGGQGWGCECRAHCRKSCVVIARRGRISGVRRTKRASAVGGIGVHDVTLGRGSDSDVAS
jgi:hypothetical protein